MSQNEEILGNNDDNDFYSFFECQFIGKWWDLKRVFFWRIIWRSSRWIRREMQRHCMRFRFSWWMDRGHNIGLIKVIKEHHHDAVADQHRALSRVVSSLHLGRHHSSSWWNCLSQVLSHQSQEVRGILFPLLDVGNTLLLDRALMLARKWFDCDEWNCCAMIRILSILLRHQNSPQTIRFESVTIPTSHPKSHLIQQLSPAILQHTSSTPP